MIIRAALLIDKIFEHGEIDAYGIFRVRPFGIGRVKNMRDVAQSAELRAAFAGVLKINGNMPVIAGDIGFPPREGDHA